MVQEGKTYSIPLAVMGNPQPIMRFRNANVSNVFYNLTVIEFKNVSRNQAGEYSFHISNNISTTIYTFTFNVTCELDVLLLVNVIC